MMRASPVVSIQPDHGGSVQLLPAFAFVPDELATPEAAAEDEGGPCCAVVGEVFPAWEAMSVSSADVRHDGQMSVSGDGARRDERRCEGMRTRCSATK